MQPDGQRRARDRSMTFDDPHVFQSACTLQVATSTVLLAAVWILPGSCRYMYTLLRTSNPTCMLLSNTLPYSVWLRKNRGVTQSSIIAALTSATMKIFFGVDSRLHHACMNPSQLASWIGTYAATRSSVISKLINMAYNILPELPGQLSGRLVLMAHVHLQDACHVSRSMLSPLALNYCQSSSLILTSGSVCTARLKVFTGEKRITSFACTCACVVW